MSYPDQEPPRRHPFLVPVGFANTTDQRPVLRVTGTCYRVRADAGQGRAAVNGSCA